MAAVFIVAIAMLAFSPQKVAANSGPGILIGQSLKTNAPNDAVNIGSYLPSTTIRATLTGFEQDIGLSSAMNAVTGTITANVNLAYLPSTTISVTIDQDVGLVQEKNMVQTTSITTSATYGTAMIFPDVGIANENMIANSVTQTAANNDDTGGMLQPCTNNFAILTTSANIRAGTTDEVTQLRV